MSVCVKQNGQLVKTAGLYRSEVPIGIADIYTEGERQVGVWKNGKPLYQKTIYLQSIDITTSSSGMYYYAMTTANYISNAELILGKTEMSYVITDGQTRILEDVEQQGALTILWSKISRPSVDAVLTLQYTKTTDTPWSGKFVPQGYGYVSSGDIYSFEERQVGVYADGKPLYQKSFSILPTAQSFAVDVSSLNIEKLIDRQATFTRLVNGTTNTQQKDAEYRTETNSNPAYGILCELRNESNIQISIENYLVSEITEIRLTLQYTKTTDVAGSGEYVPSGDKAVHYTADEHIIGTWTDGSTLYERTVRVPANTAGQNIITLWNDTNIQVRDYSGCFVFRASENTATLSCRPTDASYKLVVYTIGCSEQYGVYAEIDLGTQRGNAVDLMLTLKYIKVTS